MQNLRKQNGIDLYNDEDIFTFDIYDQKIEVRGLQIEFSNFFNGHKVNLLISFNNSLYFVKEFIFSKESEFLSTFEEIVYKELLELKYGNYSSLEKVTNLINEQIPDLKKLLLFNHVTNELNKVFKEDSFKLIDKDTRDVFKRKVNKI